MRPAAGCHAVGRARYIDFLVIVREFAFLTILYSYLCKIYYNINNYGI